MSIPRSAAAQVGCSVGAAAYMSVPHSEAAQVGRSVTVAAISYIRLDLLRAPDEAGLPYDPSKDSRTITDNGRSVTNTHSNHMLSSMQS